MKARNLIPTFLLATNLLTSNLDAQPQPQITKESQKSSERKIKPALVWKGQIFNKTSHNKKRELYLLNTAPVYGPFSLNKKDNFGKNIEARLKHVPLDIIEKDLDSNAVNILRNKIKGYTLLNEPHNILMEYLKNLELDEKEFKNLQFTSSGNKYALPTKLYIQTNSEKDSSYYIFLVEVDSLQTSKEKTAYDHTENSVKHQKYKGKKSILKRNKSLDKKVKPTTPHIPIPQDKYHSKNIDSLKKAQEELDKSQDSIARFFGDFFKRTLQDYRDSTERALEHEDRNNRLADKYGQKIDTIKTRYGFEAGAGTNGEKILGAFVDVPLKPNMGLEAYCDYYFAFGNPVFLNSKNTINLRERQFLEPGYYKQRTDDITTNTEERAMLEFGGGFLYKPINNLELISRIGINISKQEKEYLGRSTIVHERNMMPLEEPQVITNTYKDVGSAAGNLSLSQGALYNINKLGIGVSFNRVSEKNSVRLNARYNF